MGIAASGAKRPFAGMSVLGGKADFAVARPDFSVWGKADFGDF